MNFIVVYFKGLFENVCMLLYINRSDCLIERGNLLCGSSTDYSKNEALIA